MTTKSRTLLLLGIGALLALTGGIMAGGPPTPTDPASFTFVALDTRTPYTLDFAGADGGKNANYLLRWVNPAGEKGPWSETATATIGA